MSRFTTLALAAMLVPAGAGALAAQQPAPSATPSISLDKARDIALARVPNNEGVKSEKLKTKDGVLVYEFDIETEGPGHQEVRVSASDGTVVADKHEDDLVGTVVSKVTGTAKDVGKTAEKTADKVFSPDEVAQMHPAISEARAREIAQKTVPDAPIKDVDLETEDGVLVWEIDLDTAGPGHEEVLVDANNGKVLRQTHED